MDLKEAMDGALELPAISLWQPFASLVAAGKKPWETRHWAPKPNWIGRRIAIHAAKKIDTDFDAWLADVIADALGDKSWSEKVPRGAVICTAMLTGAYRVAAYDWFRDEAEVAEPVIGSPDLAIIKTDDFGDYSDGRWVWRLTDIRKLTVPVPCKGQQSWFTFKPGRHWLHQQDCDYHVDQYEHECSCGLRREGVAA